MPAGSRNQRKQNFRHKFLLVFYFLVLLFLSSLVFYIYKFKLQEPTCDFHETCIALHEKQNYFINQIDAGADKKVFLIQMECGNIVMKTGSEVSGDKGLIATSIVGQSLSHPNIVKNYGLCDVVPPALIEQYIPGARLNSRLHTKKDLRLALKYAITVTRIAAYLLNSPLGALIHCDFIPQNFIVTTRGNELILVDLDAIWSVERNNFFYLPPRERTGKLQRWNTETDSPVTCISHSECKFCGNVPESKCDFNLKQCAPFSIKEAFVYSLCKNMLGPILTYYKDNLSFTFPTMISRCLDKDPLSRPSVDEILAELNHIHRIYGYPVPKEHWWKFWK